MVEAVFSCINGQKRMKNKEGSDVDLDRQFEKTTNTMTQLLCL